MRDELHYITYRQCINVCSQHTCDEHLENCCFRKPRVQDSKRGTFEKYLAEFPINVLLQSNTLIKGGLDKSGRGKWQRVFFCLGTSHTVARMTWEKYKQPRFFQDICFLHKIFKNSSCFHFAGSGVCWKTFQKSQCWMEVPCPELTWGRIFLIGM